MTAKPTHPTAKLSGFKGAAPRAERRAAKQTVLRELHSEGTERKDSQGQQCIVNSNLALENDNVPSSSSEGADAQRNAVCKVTSPGRGHQKDFHYTTLPPLAHWKLQSPENHQ